MGLLDRLRPARPADRTSRPSEAAPTTSAPAATPASGEDVITADDLWHVAEWERIPPIAPILEEPQWVHSHHFEDSLASWQPPQPFLGELGHSVSEAAPSGLVDGLAVLSPASEPEREPFHAVRSSESLPLAVPPTPSKPEPQLPGLRRPWAWNDAAPEGPAEDLAPAEPVASVQPVPVTEPAALPVDEPVAAAPEPPADEPAPAVGEATPALAEVAPAGTEPPPPAELVGAAPLEPVVQRLVSSDTGPSRLTHAPTPPDMPLVELPSSQLPRELRRPQVAEPPQSEVPPEPVPSPVGTHTPPERPHSPAPAAATVEESPAIHPSSADLPLARPPEAPAAPLVGAAEPLVAEGPARESEPEAPPAEDASGDDLPLAQPPPPSGVPGGAETVAPLVSQATPLAPEPQPLASSPEMEDASGDEAIDVPQESVSETDRPLARPQPPGGRRAGLGAPLPGLPSTAARWDITKMSPPEQMRVARAMVRGPVQPRLHEPPGLQMPLAPQAASLPAAPMSQSTEPVYAGTPLPLVPLEQYPSERSESSGSDEGESPILPMSAPLLSPETEVPTSVQRTTPSSEGAQVRATIGRRHGLDLSTVPVDRSDRAAGQAKQMGARAFTSHNGVTIPSSLGSLNTGEGEASLAHELTHVAQRARYGTSLPSEDSTEGQRLEAEARAAEMVYAPAAAGRPTPIQPLHNVEATGDGTSLPLAGRASGPSEEALAESIFQRLSSLSTPAPALMESTVMTSPFMSTPAFPSMGIQRQTETETTTTDTQTASTTDTTTKTPDAKDGPFGKRPSDNDLANLSYWLYPLISHKLKGELREGRERLGMITDHYRKW